MTIRYKFPEEDPFWKKSFGERFNYFSDEMLANEWLEQIVNAIYWELSKDTDSWLYRAGEFGYSSNPKLKENISIEKIEALFDSEIAFLRYCVVSYILRLMLHDDIDLSNDAIVQLLDDGYGDELVDFHQLIPRWIREE